MRAGACPNCGVELCFIFGDPEVAAAYARVPTFRLVTIEDNIERSVSDGTNRKDVLRAGHSCPNCHGLIGSRCGGGLSPAMILGRMVETGVDVGLEVAG